MKTSCPTTTSMRIKALVRCCLVTKICTVFRSIAKVKTTFVEIIVQNHSKFIKEKKTKRKMHSSVKFHYNWSSSHVLPIPESTVDEFDTMYYDPTWNSVFSVDHNEEDLEPQLSEYPNWLEENDTDRSMATNGFDEIDRLAEAFIADFHEKFRLEKQESYRRYQEMLARSM